MIVYTKDHTVTCSICGYLVQTQIEGWHFTYTSLMFTIFDNKPYFLCGDDCIALFQLAPATAKPVEGKYAY